MYILSRKVAGSCVFVFVKCSISDLFLRFFITTAAGQILNSGSLLYTTQQTNITYFLQLSKYFECVCLCSCTS